MGRIAGDLKERTLDFGLSVLNMIPSLPNEARGWIVAKQLARSATSIGANVWEADAAFTDSDFAHKVSIARKEAQETQYWLLICERSNMVACKEITSLKVECMELSKILGSIVKRTQEYIESRKQG